jgi:hypothetical protein
VGFCWLWCIAWIQSAGIYATAQMFHPIHKVLTNTPKIAVSVTRDTGGVISDAQIRSRLPNLIFLLEKFKTGTC